MSLPNLHFPISKIYDSPPIRRIFISPARQTSHAADRAAPSLRPVNDLLLIDTNMDDFARPAERSDGVLSERQQAESLAQQNAVLKEAVASLRALLDAEANPAVSAELQQLREANQHLVLATLGAQDLQTAAEAVNRRQTVFLSMLAHELRTPLAPIAAANSLLEGLAGAHPLLPKLTAVLQRQVNHLAHLVDDLLDASRIASGKISMQKRLVTLQDIIEGAIETTQPAFDARGQQVLASLASTPVALLADPVRLTQLFSNLLINASKFSGSGAAIEVSATVQDDTVRVSVKDPGAGIAHDLQPHIFDLFTQGEQTLDRAAGGLGIGLSLVRSIAEMHGGAVTAHSDGPGCGSEFMVSLPLAQQAPRAPAPSPPAPQARA